MGSSSDNSQNFDSIKSLHEPRGVIKKKKEKATGPYIIL